MFNDAASVTPTAMSGSGVGLTVRGWAVMF